MIRLTTFISLLAALVSLLIVGSLAQADVITAGDVEPGGPGTQADPWVVRGKLYVGKSGSGTLNVEAGGLVSNNFGYIGYNFGSTGVATVTGEGSQWNTGSQWNNSGFLFVGLKGSGTLNVEAGGVVSSAFGNISYSSNSTGVVLVRGSGSQWNNSANLRVGESGSGTLSVEAGGVVSSYDSYIGHQSNSTGMATVSGSGSAWNNRDSLYLGGQKDAAGGSGMISVLDNGTLSVMGSTVIWNGGTLKLGSGTFTSGDVVMKGGKIVTSTAEGENGFLFLDNVGEISGFGDISLPVHLGTVGSVQGSDGTLTLSGGLIGSGTVMGATLGGAIDLGGTPGTLSLADVFVNSDAVFKIEIAGTALTDYDRLLLAGVTIAGNLEVELINEFMPQVGDTFNLLNLASDAVLHGSFSNIVLPDLTTGLWDTSGLLASGNILVVSGVTAFPGDTNNDQQVTGGDLIAVQQNFGTIYPSDPNCGGLGLGDANDDCQVTGADLIAVQQNYGNTLVPIDAPVPEPASIFLLTLASLGVMARRCQVAA